VTDYAATYRQAREDLVALAPRLTNEDLRRVVPACPAWTVKDVYAHVTGVAADTVAGNRDGAPGEAWTAAQVDARKDLTIEEILDEWERTGAALEALLEREGGRWRASVIDVWTHGQDVRNAVGRPGNRAGEGRRLAAGAVLVAGPRIVDAGLPALRVVADPFEFVAGDGPAGATVVVDVYELARATLGRRSVAQMAAWDWSVDPTPYLPHLTVFPPRETPLVEA